MQQDTSIPETSIIREERAKRAGEPLTSSQVEAFSNYRELANDTATLHMLATLFGLKRGTTVCCSQRTPTTALDNWVTNNPTIQTIDQLGLPWRVAAGTTDERGHIATIYVASTPEHLSTITGDESAVLHQHITDNGDSFATFIDVPEADRHWGDQMLRTRYRFIDEYLTQDENDQDLDSDDIWASLLAHWHHRPTISGLKRAAVFGYELLDLGEWAFHTYGIRSIDTLLDNVVSRTITTRLDNASQDTARHARAIRQHRSIEEYEPPCARATHPLDAPSLPSVR